MAAAEDQMVTGIAPATMAAAADGGARRGHGTERENEGGGVGMDRTLTLSTMEWPARAGEAGRRGGGARTVAAGAGEGRTASATWASPPRFLGRGGAQPVRSCRCGSPRRRDQSPSKRRWASMFTCITRHHLE